MYFNYERYQKYINNVLHICPLESGVQALVLNVLIETLSSADLTAAIIDNLHKGLDTRLQTPYKMSDIAIVTPDFEYQEPIGKVLGFVEVKSLGWPCTNKSEIKNSKFIEHFIYTNGIVWKYYHNGELDWEINITNNDKEYVNNGDNIVIDKDRYIKLIGNLSTINWEI